MKIQSIELDEIKLVGIKIRTNNANELTEEKAKIGACVLKFFSERLFEQIPNRLSPGKTYCVYTDYESDFTGEYTFFIGEEVSSFEDLPESLSKHTIPTQNYIKHTTDAGPMPTVVQNAWQEIWSKDQEALGGERAYHSDFEIYDQRAINPLSTVVDIYIGVKAPILVTE